MLVLTTTAFHSLNSTDGQYKVPPIYKLMEVASLWDLMAEDYEPSREKDGTWLDVGFRAKYGMTIAYASLDILETTFETPVFLRGPHGETMNYQSKTSFGYYNPEFISRLKSSIKTILEIPAYRRVVKKVYDQHLKGMANTYHEAYSIFEEPGYLEDLQCIYLRQMAEPEGVNNIDFAEEFRSFADRLSNGPEKYDFYEAHTAPSFWLRRSIDGTADDIYAVLDMVIKNLEQ